MRAQEPRRRAGIVRTPEALGAVLLLVLGLFFLPLLTGTGQAQDEGEEEGFGGLLGQAGRAALQGGVAGAAAGASTSAPAILVRKNANTMPSAERKRFRKAIYALMDRPGTAGAYYDMYVQIHDVASPHAHFGPAFLPWHRAFLHELEQDLQAIDPGVAIPYWDWTQRAPNVFTDELFGGNGGATGKVILNRSGASRTIRRGGFDPTTVVPVSATRLATINRVTDYLQWVTSFEITHGQAHTTIGWDRARGRMGDLGDIPTAVRDPYFFLLHAYVDKVWAEKQEAWARSNPGRPATDFYWDGRSTLDSSAPPSIWTSSHRIDSLMWPWNGRPSRSGSTGVTIPRYQASPKNWKPEDFFDISALGYRYD